MEGSSAAGKDGEKLGREGERRKMGNRGSERP